MSQTADANPDARIPVREWATPAFGLVVGKEALVILTDGRVFRFDPSPYDHNTGPGWEEYDPIPGTEVAVAEAAERLRLAQESGA